MSSTAVVEDRLNNSGKTNIFISFRKKKEDNNNMEGKKPEENYFTLRRQRMVSHY